jgi:hypothetical protein
MIHPYTNYTVLNGRMRDFEESHCGIIKVISRHLPGGTVENNEKM